MSPALPFVFDPVKHCYSLGGKPLIGTTTALSILDKPLSWWASGMAVGAMGWQNPKKTALDKCLESAALMLEKIKSMGAKEYLDLLNSAYRAHNKKKETSKESGKSMHEALEEYIRAKMSGAGPFIPDPRIRPFQDWAERNVSRFLFSEACCYSQVLYCGGTADFGYEDLNGNYVLGDFKSSEAAYFSYWLQCGAYDLQLSENGGFTPQGKKIFIADKPFRSYAIFAERHGLDKPYFGHDTDRLKRAFSYCVNLYRERLFWEGNHG